VAALHLLEHVQPLQHPVGFGDQRFADVKAGKLLSFEEADFQSALRQDRRRGGSGGSAADHNDIVFT
jgi:hypothetical protein